VTSSEFTRRLLQEGASCGLSETSLEFAAMECRREGRTTERDIPIGLYYAARHDKYWAFRLQREAQGTEPMADEDDSRSPPGLTPDDLIHHIAPTVKAIRQQEFHRDDPPYRSMEEAAPWIEQEARAPYRGSPEQKASEYALKCRIEQLLNEWSARTHLDWRGGDRTRFLTYERTNGTGTACLRLPDPDPDEEHPAVRSPLARLQSAAVQMAEATGFSDPSLITYILTGIEPRLRPVMVSVRWQFHEGMDIYRQEMRENFLTGDVPFEEQRQIYRDYRAFFSTMRKKRLSAQDEDFLALVRQHGPVPQGRGSGAMAYWEDVRQKWNRKRGREVWKEAAAARKHYHRLITRRQKRS
jgi:hypothetical protein